MNAVTCDECDDPIKARGKCARHYNRAYRVANAAVLADKAAARDEPKRRQRITAWYDAQMASVDMLNLPVGEALIERFHIEGALALLTKLHSRRPETLLHDPDYEFTGGLLRCLEAGREALGYGTVR